MTLLDGRHFTVAELASHDGVPYPEEFADRLPALMAMLDAIRDAWEAPIRVVSGYRSPAHNQALIEADNAKGQHQVASGSQHVEGRAADICPAEGPFAVPGLWRVIREMVIDSRLPMLGGYAVYNTSGWVHVDCRPKPPDGHIATWVGV